MNNIQFIDHGNHLVHAHPAEPRRRAPIIVKHEKRIVLKNCESPRCFCSSSCAEGPHTLDGDHWVGDRLVWSEQVQQEQASCPAGCERHPGPACTDWPRLFATVTHRLSSWARTSSLKVHKGGATPAFLRPCRCSVRSRSSRILPRRGSRLLEESTRLCQEGKSDVI